MTERLGTIFNTGSVGASIASQQALRLASLENFIDSLEMYQKQLESSIDAIPKICQAIKDRAEEQYNAGLAQGVGQIIAGGIGVAGAGATLYYQTKTHNELLTAEKAGDGSVQLNGQKTPPKGNETTENRDVSTPKNKEALEREFKMSDKWSQLAHAISPAVQGGAKIISSEYEKEAANYEAVQKQLEAGQQSLSRFMELVQAQKQLAERMLEDAKRAHEEIIRAAHSRG